MWYNGGAAYWANTAESNDGVLGGFGDVHEADTADSLRFARRCGVPASKRNGGERELRALDVAAGIGRVTGGALLELCDTVDLVEVRPAKLSPAELSPAKPRFDARARAACRAATSLSSVPRSTCRGRRRVSSGSSARPCRTSLQKRGGTT